MSEPLQAASKICARAMLVEGPKASGKTSRLIDRLFELLSAGICPQDIVLIAATPDAAHALEECIAAKALSEGEARPAAKILTARELGLSILATPETRLFLGREPQLLLPFEKKVLLEDLDTLGMQPRRMREMLRFFEKEMADSQDGGDGFIKFQEERELYDHLAELLRFEGGMLPVEVSGLALRFLLSNQTSLERARIGYVLADDFQLMSRASQTLLSLLAAEELMVAADAKATHPAFEEYPYPHFEDDLAELFDRLEREELAPAPANAVERIESTTPDEEFAEVASQIAAALTENPAAKIYLASPNKTWSEGLSSALREKGVEHAIADDGRALACDVADEASSLVAKACSLLVLAENPDDSVAWRSLCGLGVTLANSAGNEALMSSCKASGSEGESQRLVDALAEATRQSSEGAPPLQAELGLHSLHSVADMTSAYQEGRNILEQAEGLGGSELVKCICNSISREDETLAPELADKLARICRTEDFDALPSIAGALLQHASFPTLPEGPQVVIGPYAGTTGLSPDVVFATGAVEGFILSREHFDATVTTPEKHTRELEGWRASVYQTLGNTRARRAASSFEHLPLERAERLGVRIRRIAVINGRRAARTYRSELVDC